MATVQRGLDQLWRDGNRLLRREGIGAGKLRRQEREDIANGQVC